MIVDAIVGVLTSVITFLLGLLPSWSAPSWLTGSGPDTLAGLSGQLGSWLSGWDAWIPWTWVAAGVAAMFAVALVTVAVRVAMWAINAIISVIP